VYGAWGNGSEDYWRPSKNLIGDHGLPDNSSINIIFVNSLHIYYEYPSRDPLFPTDSSRKIQGSLWYYKSDPKARAAACIDETKFGSRCRRKAGTWFTILLPEVLFGKIDHLRFDRFETWQGTHRTRLGQSVHISSNSCKSLDF
jgi:hypothetical protein